MFALVWYIIAYVLFKTGHGQLWMLIAMPLLALFPIGAAKEGTVSAMQQMPKEDDEFFDCVDDQKRSEQDTT